MIAWTDSAQKAWAQYISQTRAALEGTGADPEEVLEDLKRHVDEEAAAAKLGVVTEEDLRKILAKIGPAGAAKLEAGKPPPEAPARAETSRWSKFASLVLLFFGVLLPLITILFEWFTGISAEVLFDPIPIWFHVVICALVPIGNAWLWMATRRRHCNHKGWLGWLNGFVLGVCIFYSIIYVPFFPFACIAVIYFGLGLIPLAPYLAMITTLLLRVRYCRVTGLGKLPGSVPGAAIALICLLLLQLPESVTIYGLARAKSDDKATQNYGLRVLRTFGNRTVMLRACYGTWQFERMQANLLNTLAMGNVQQIDSDFAREMYYRVTGDSFDSEPPPSLYNRAGRWTVLDDEYDWTDSQDEGQGGERVAGRLKGLSLLSSRMDTTTEPDAGIAYCQWTLEFKNVSHEQREARAEIALPPGAVVSRVTLWVDGEEREAAFGGRAQTRTAYQEEGVQRRRDPLLVTTCGPDRVLVQCFPVQPSGGTMKIRLGITAPLVLDSLASGSFVWPHFLERNFGIAPDFKHSLWLEQPGADRNMTGTYESLAETNLSASVHATAVHRRAEIDTVWTPTETPGQLVRQTIRSVKAAVPERIVVVLDGSAGMQRHLPEITRELGEVPETSDLAVVVASDEPQPLKTEIQKATAANKAGLQQQLRGLKFTGGQDNLPALETAWDLADAADNGDVVWIHLSEPLQLSSESGISQRLERNRKPTRLEEIQLDNGPDQIVEKLDGFPSIEHVISCVPGQNGFDRLLSLWSGQSQIFVYVRQLTNAVPGSTDWQVSKHLARLWARDESLRMAGNRQRAAATKLAAENQLVTPLTGAVVLENQAQYDRHNLSPADPGTVPDIPEPAHLTILALVIALYVLKRRHQSRKESN